MLISKKTNLKSLKFGNTDKPGGKSTENKGFNNQPYEIKEIPGADGSFVNEAGQEIIYTGPGILGTGGPDIIIRGGALSITRSAKDVSRLTKMFLDTSNGARGIQYTVKENILSRTSVKTEASTGLGYAGGFANQGVYTPLSTIGQAGANAFGGHLNHLGLDPTSPMSGVTGEGLFPGSGLQKYEDVVRGKNLNGGNRLKELQSRLFKDSPLPPVPNPLTGITYGGGSQDLFILEYGGGPGSILGIGKTTIKASRDRIGKNLKGEIVKNKFQFSPSLISGINFNSPTQTEVENQMTTVGTLSDSGTSLIVNKGVIDYSKLNPSDFRKELDSFKEAEENESSKVLSLSPAYNDSKKNIHGRVNLGDPGKRNTEDDKNVWNYSADNLEALDTITSSPIISTSGSNVSSGDKLNDLAQFRIAALYNSKGDGSAAYMHFRAFIDSFNDAYTANWNPVNYVGRGDTLYNYGNFGRTVNMSFTIAAQSKPELMPMYDKLNYLASTLAPDYSKNGFMRGNIIRLTVGGYIREQHGFISSLTYDVPQESPWEIAIKSDWDEFGSRGDSSVKELPHVIKASITFTPIHNFLPQKVQSISNTKQNYILGNGLK